MSKGVFAKETRRQSKKLKLTHLFESVRYRTQKLKKNYFRRLLGNKSNKQPN